MPPVPVRTAYVNKSAKDGKSGSSTSVRLPPPVAIPKPCSAALTH
jgi:hypothetical protein